jgi:DNA (cytosine-5)-methyltransferase 1
MPVLSVTGSPMAKDWPIAIDLFCGAGGLTTGLLQARFRVVAASDIDGLAVKAYRLNHRQVPVWETDMRSLSVASIRRELDLRPGVLDLLAACPPCEGFSRIRTRNGKRRPRDARNDLILELARFVRGLRPKTIMVENVPKLARDRRLRHLRNELHELGYWSGVRIADAAHFGVPQRRKRMVLLASRLGPVEFPASSGLTVTVRETIGMLPSAGVSGDPLHDVGESRAPRILDMIRAVPRDGGSRNDLGAERQLSCHIGFDGFKDVYGRMAWDAVAPTITGGCVNPSKGRFLHPEEDRAITLREAALLQGFPPRYRLPLDRGKFAAASLIGNALPPEFARRHAAALRLHIREMTDAGGHRNGRR